MYLDNERAERRLRSKENLANIFYVGDNKVMELPTRLPKGPPVPDAKIVEATTRARIGAEPIREIAEDLGVSEASIRAHKNGKSYEKESVSNAIEENLSKIRDSALEKLMQSLNLLDDKKLGVCDARDLSSISANLSKVIEKTLPKSQSEGNQVNIVIYAPEQRKESSFKVVEI